MVYLRKKDFKGGDIINIDITVIKDEFHGDIGKNVLRDVPNQRLIKVTQNVYILVLKRLSLEIH